jgi:hypothetical protein
MGPTEFVAAALIPRQQAANVRRRARPSLSRRRRITLMSRSSLPVFSRTVRFLATICQIAVGLLLPVVEAQSEARSATARSHIEEASSRACPPIHVDSACQVCRVMRSPALLASAEALPDVGHAAQVVLRVWREAAPDLAVVSSLHSRAPPTA